MSHLGVCDRHQWLVERCRQTIEANGSQAQEAGEDENSHAFGHAGVTPAGLVLRVVHHAVDVQVTQADHHESCDVAHQDGDHVHLSSSRLRVHGQADAHLLVTAHADQRQQRKDQAQQPASEHQRGRVA